MTRHAVTIALAAALLLLLVGVWASAWVSTPRNAPLPIAAAPASSVRAGPAAEPPPTVMPPAKADSSQLPRAAEPALSPYTIPWPFEVDSVTTFGPEGGMRMRLAGIVGPGRDDVCFDGSGRLWGCGLKARAALHNTTRNQALLCTPVAEPTDVVIARCRVGEADLAEVLARTGFVRAAPGAPPLPAQSEAEAGGKGLWDGGWRIR